MKQRNTTKNLFIAIPNEETKKIISDLFNELIMYNRIRSLKTRNYIKILKQNIVKLVQYNAYRDSLFIPLWWLEKWIVKRETKY